MIRVCRRVKPDKAVRDQLPIAQVAVHIVRGRRAVRPDVQNAVAFPQLIGIPIPAGEHMHQLAVHQRIQVVNDLPFGVVGDDKLVRAVIVQIKERIAQLAGRGCVAHQKADVRVAARLPAPVFRQGGDIFGDDRLVGFRNRGAAFGWRGGFNGGVPGSRGEGQVKGVGKGFQRRLSRLGVPRRGVHHNDHDNGVAGVRQHEGIVLPHGNEDIRPGGGDIVRPLVIARILDFPIGRGEGLLHGAVRPVFYGVVHAADRGRAPEFKIAVGGIAGIAGGHVPVPGVSDHASDIQRGEHFFGGIRGNSVSDLVQAVFRADFVHLLRHFRIPAAIGAVRFGEGLIYIASGVVALDVVLDLHAGLVICRGLQAFQRQRRGRDIGHGRRSLIRPSEDKNAQQHHRKQRRGGGNDRPPALRRCLLLMRASAMGLFGGKLGFQSRAHSGSLGRRGVNRVQSATNHLTFHLSAPPNMVISCFLARDRRLRTVLSGQF